MASPQLENGFTRIANELLEALYHAKLTGGELRVILCVIRASYGWSQPVAPISIREIARRLIKHPGYIQKVVTNLMARGFIARNGVGLYLVKDYDLWANIPAHPGVSTAHPQVSTPLTQESAPPLTPVCAEMASNLAQVKSLRAPKSISKTITKTNTGDFDRFWKVWPRKVAKEAARKVWQKIDLSDGLLDRILAAVELNKRSNPQWAKDNGQFIPHPATWLNGKQWNDEIKQDTSGVPETGWDCKKCGGYHTGPTYAHGACLKDHRPGDRIYPQL